MGEGDVEQVHDDLLMLQDLGAEYVLLDTKRSSPTASTSRHHQEAWRTLTVLAEQVIDIEGESVR